MKGTIKPNLLDDYHLLSYDELDSTNDEARRIAEGGGSHGAVIWAREQTEGRGRMDREWISEDGNLYVSILLAPGCDLETCSQLSFVTAVAAVETLEPLLLQGGELSCKWPNDILLDGKKLGGILLESLETAADEPGDNALTRWVIVGVGINIDNCPDDTDIPATYIKSAGVEIVSAKIVLSRFIHHFITWYDIWSKKGFTPVRKAWMDYAYGVGEEARVHLPNDTFSGTFDKIDTKGRMILLEKGGKKRTITVGDVFFEEAAG